MLVFLLIFIFYPEDLFAWAPATHLIFAKQALEYSHWLPQGIRELLTTHRIDFMYGCLAADITLGKKFVEYIYNCHNFDVGMNLLKFAKRDDEKAFVYGYLSHLAADTVSHNFFVPYQNLLFLRGRVRHAYWEVRLDEFFIDEVIDELAAVMKNPNTYRHDRILDRALKNTIFSFRTNRMLFSSMMAIQRFNRWRKFIGTINRYSKKRFSAHHLNEYNQLAVSAIILFLSEGKRSPVYLVDPTGAKIFEEMESLRKHLKGLKRSNGLTKRVQDETCEEFRHHVRSLYFDRYSIKHSFRPSLRGLKA